MGNTRRRRRRERSRTGRLTPWPGGRTEERRRRRRGRDGAVAINPGSNRKSETDLRTVAVESLRGRERLFATHELATTGGATPSFVPSSVLQRGTNGRLELDSHDVNGIPGRMGVINGCMNSVSGCDSCLAVQSSFSRFIGHAPQASPPALTWRELRISPAG